MRENYSDSKYAVQLLDPQTISGDGSEHDGSWVDLKNFRDGVLLVSAGAIDAATTVTIQCQTAEDDSGTGAADVLSADQSFTNTGANAVHAYELKNLKRYVRLQYKVTNAKNALIGAVVVGWNRFQVPAS